MSIRVYIQVIIIKLLTILRTENTMRCLNNLDILLDKLDSSEKSNHLSGLSIRLVGESLVHPKQTRKVEEINK